MTDSGQEPTLRQMNLEAALLRRHLDRVATEKFITDERGITAAAISHAGDVGRARAGANLGRLARAWVDFRNESPRWPRYRVGDNWAATQNALLLALEKARSEPRAVLSAVTTANLATWLPPAMEQAWLSAYEETLPELNRNQVKELIAMATGPVEEARKILKRLDDNIGHEFVNRFRRYEWTVSDYAELNADLQKMTELKTRVASRDEDAMRLIVLESRIADRETAVRRELEALDEACRAEFGKPVVTQMMLEVFDAVLRERRKRGYDGTDRFLDLPIGEVARDDQSAFGDDRSEVLSLLPNRSEIEGFPRVVIELNMGMTA